VAALNARGPLIRAKVPKVACQADRIGRWQIGLSRMEDALFIAEERASPAGVPRRRHGTCFYAVR